jgi:putative ABC transport system substrate-binding protein
MNTIHRRDVMTFVLGIAAAPVLSRPAGAQDARRYRLGVLSGRGRDSDYFAAFFDELRLFGVIEGQNLVVLHQGFNFTDEQLPKQTAEVVKASPDAIFVGGDLAARSVRKATSAIPIVALTDDMIEAGLVRSLAHPDANVTGVSLLASELDGKRQDILLEAVPGVHRIALLRDASSKLQQLRTLQDAAHARGVELATFAVAKPEEIVPAIDAAKGSGAAALNVLAASLFSINRGLVIEGANTARLPAIYQWPEMAEDGGLIGYGPRLTVIYRQLARLVAKVLRSVRSADLPVEQPTNFELVINLRTAKAIGHEVPTGLLLRADKVIE